MSVSNTKYEADGNAVRLNGECVAITHGHGADKFNNAALIVRALNTNAELLEACHAALKMRALLGTAGNTLGLWQERIAAVNEANALSDQIRAAIAKATNS